MRLSVTNDAGDLYSVEIDADQSIEDIKAIVEVESSIPITEQTLLHNGQTLGNGPVSGTSIVDGDLLLVRRAAPARVQVDPNDPRSIHAAFRSDPATMAQIRQSNPRLAAAAEKEDPTEFIAIYAELKAEKERAEEEAMVRRSRMVLDPLDPEAQAAMMEELRKEQINQNMETAMEHNPEAFGSVVMLYVDCELNQRPLKAFVDSGAQMTIMSQPCAERCGLMHLVDKRWQGIAKGVGTSKIVGRVHSAPLKIGNPGIFISISITVLEDDSMEFLFGLDNLRRHQCCIDLLKNQLTIGDLGVPFLPEHEIPNAFGAKGSTDGDGAGAGAGDAMDSPTLKREIQKISAGDVPSGSGSGSAGAPIDKVPRTEGVGATAPGASAGAAAGSAAAARASGTAGTAGAAGAATGLSANALAGALAGALSAAARPQSAPAHRPAAPTTATAVAPTTTPDWEAKVGRLMVLGFDRPQVEGALRLANGNEEVAAGILFG